MDAPSTVVKLATSSEYVHVAIVLSVQGDPAVDPAVLIAESHIDISLPSVGTGKRILGVQTQWLSSRLATAVGPTWWAPLKTPLQAEALDKMQTWLYSLEAQRIPYDFVQAIGAGIDLFDSIGLCNTANDAALFCSELVTRALQIAGVLDPQINAAEQTPTDVMRFPCFKPLVLIQNQPLKVI